MNPSGRGNLVSRNYHHDFGRLSRGVFRCPITRECPVARKVPRCIDLQAVNRLRSANRRSSPGSRFVHKDPNLLDIVRQFSAQFRGLSPDRCFSGSSHRTQTPRIRARLNRDECVLQVCNAANLDPGHVAQGEEKASRQFLASQFSIAAKFYFAAGTCDSTSSFRSASPGDAACISDSPTRNA